MSLTPNEIKEHRREANHAYYTKNSQKWISHYRRSVKAQVGTGGLSAHRLPDFDDELKAIEKEMVRLGLRKTGSGRS